MTETIAASRPALDRGAAAEARRAALAQASPGDRSGRSLRCRDLPRGLGQARSLAFPAELRAKKEERNGQLLYHVSGIASVTDVPYEMYDMFGPYDEIVERGAFTDTLAAEPDVAFLVNHRGVTMARTTNGTLELSMVSDGLGSEAWLNPKRQDVTDLVLAIEDRNIDQMSFAFILEEGWWSDDFSTFKISKVDIHRGDVSAVNYGANPYTSITARSREILDELEHLPTSLARAALARLTGRADLGGQGSTPQTPARTPGAQSDAPAVQDRQTGRSVLALDAWIATVEATR